MKINKQNLPLILAFGAPVLMIIIVAAVIYLPNLYNKPQYDFIYSQGSYYLGYTVINGKIAKVPPLPDQPKPPVTPLNQDYPQLYYYDVQNNKSTAISLEQADNYNIDPSSISPDGYTVGYGNRADGFFPLFISSSVDYQSRYLQGHSTNRKLNLQNQPDYYANNFQFMGWVKK